MKQLFLNEYFENVLSFFQIRHTLNYHNSQEIRADYKDIYNKRFNILWGYYEILRKKNETIISQLYTRNIDNEKLKKFRTNVYNFNFIEVTKGEGIEDKFIDIVEESLRSCPQDFNKKFNVPKSFQYLDYFNIDIERTVSKRKKLRRNSSKGPILEDASSNRKLVNILTDFYKNTEIQKELDKHPFYVVLNEEVYFFLLLFLIFNKKSSKTEIKAYIEKIRSIPHQYGLKQLLKFATSLVFCDNILSDESEYNLFRKEWEHFFSLNSYEEKEYRRIINETFDFEINKIADLLYTFCTYFIKESRIRLQRHFDEELDDKKLLNLLTRFHVKPYLSLLEKYTILPDFFVFPIFHNYMNTGINQLKTRNLPLESEGGHYINLNRPVLFSCYVRSIFEIERKNGNIIFDESPETIKGFHLTKVVAKELAAPLVQSEFFGPQILNLIRPQAIKSSLAAVMARNLSHNIGSHVLNKLSNKEIVEQFFGLDNSKANDRFVYARSKESSEKYDFNKSDKVQIPRKYTFFTVDKNPSKAVYTLSNFFRDFKNNTKNTELARIFNDYLKKRMDFVADVATTDQATLTNNRNLFSEVFRNFEANLLLLHNISGKEDQFSYRFSFEYESQEGEIYTPEDKNFIDPIIAMPNDILGDQAFYIILENIIRNTAKHSSKNDVCFTIKVKEKYRDFYLVTVYDDVEYEDDNFLKELILSRNLNIATPILDITTNAIRSNGWGTIELKLAACYLSRVSTILIDEPEYAPFGLEYYKYLKNEEVTERNTSIVQKYYEYITGKFQHTIDISNKGDWEEAVHKGIRKKGKKTRIPLLQATDGISKEKKRGFGYSFLMKCPQTILVVTKNLLGLDETVQKSLQRIGVKCLTLLDFNKRCAADEVWHFDILLTDTSIVLTNKMPQRFECLNSNDVEKLMQTLINKELLDRGLLLYHLKQFYYRNCNDEHAKIDFDDKLIRESPNEAPLKLIKFDHHGKSIDFEASYYEPYGSSSSIQSFIDGKELELNKIKDKIHDFDDMPQALKNEILWAFKEVIRGQLIEAVETKIIVIDERIQALLNSRAFQCELNNENMSIPQDNLTLSYQELFSRTNIHVLSSDGTNQDLGVDLNKKPFIESKDDWLHFINYVEKVSQGAHYLVLHFGILEMLRGKAYNIEGELLDNVSSIKNLILSKINKCKLIITSGRGSTPDVKELNLPFVSYSSFSNCLVDPNNRSKLHLTNLLKSARND